MTNNNINIDTIIKQIEKSSLWVELNNKCKKLYEQHNRIPSEEEYQALRNILICKVMLEDEEVKNKICEYTWNELQKV